MLIPTWGNVIFSDLTDVRTPLAETTMEGEGVDPPGKVFFAFYSGQRPILFKRP